MPVSFFRATRSVADNFTRISTFLAATQCSFWNTRLEVAGFSASVSDAPETLLQQRFVMGSRIQGVNITEAFVRNDSAYESSNLANLLLFTVIASYEGFLEEIVPGCGGTRAQIDQMQLNNRSPSGHSRLGISDAIATFLPNRDPDMVKAFQANLTSNPRNSLTALNNQMIEYRLFKEIRNTMMHNRGIAGARLALCANL